VLPLIGGTVTIASRRLGHIVSFAVNAAVLLFAFAFVLFQSKNRAAQPTHWLRFGPTYLTGLAAVLIMADPLRHILADEGIWKTGPWPGCGQYLADCAVRAMPDPAVACKENADCGAVACGGGFYSAAPGENCYTCYADSGECSKIAETFACLSPVGWVFTVGFTYAGFALFLSATLWNANLIAKLDAVSSKWKALQGSE